LQNGIKKSKGYKCSTKRNEENKEAHFEPCAASTPILHPKSVKKYTSHPSKAQNGFPWAPLLPSKHEPVHVPHHSNNQPSSPKNSGTFWLIWAYRLKRLSIPRILNLKPRKLIMYVLVAPGLVLQHFTTRESDDKMIVVAIKL